jgi:hypothetical protein
LSYNGIIKVVSQDEQAGVAVLEGRGREARGNGTATATITCRLVENNGSTDVFVDTDLAITGKPAQFGRGALADVAATLIGQFATNLADEITASAQPAEPLRAVTEEPDAGAPTVTAQRQRTTASRTPAEPLDLLAAAGSAQVVRYSGFAAALMLVVLVAVIRRRARRG